MTESDRRGGNASNPEVVWQLAMAFGQGAGGTMMATRSALRAAYDAYGRALSDLQEFEEVAVSVLEFSRVLGRLAAGHAIAAGRCVIESEDIEYSLPRVRQAIPEPLGNCGLTGSLA
jgi:hypothetical protein